LEMKPTVTARAAEQSNVSVRYPLFLKDDRGGTLPVRLINPFGHWRIMTTYR